MSNTAFITDLEIDPSDRWDLDRERPCANTDWTLDLPPIEGTSDLHPMDCRCLRCEAEAEAAAWIGCECEIDWKCGLCREEGIRHSRLDAAGLGPDADLSEGNPWADLEAAWQDEARREQEGWA